MTAPTDADLQRLAERVKARRLELELGIQPAAVLAGMSKDTWKRVEAGLTVRATSYSAIDRALQWAPGSCTAILAGAPGPVRVEPIGGGTVIAKLPEEELHQAVTNAAIAVTDNLTAREIRELSQRVLEELKGRGFLD